jgi:hypothetical protein
LKIYENIFTVDEGLNKKNKIRGAKKKKERHRRCPKRDSRLRVCGN